MITFRKFVRLPRIGAWRNEEHRRLDRVYRGHALVALVAALSGPNPVSAASAYDDVIAPIFRARCAECHGERKQKAKLALHTWEGLMKGSDAGPVIVAGKPGESPLIERLRLPASDEDHMPPQEKPQPAPEEIALIAQWIERGASPTATVAELQLPEPLRRAVMELPAKLTAIEQVPGPVEPMWELDAAAVAKQREPLAAKVAELQRRFPGALSYESRTSADLHFTAAGLGRDFGDAEFSALVPLREHLVLIDLAGTGITDASADTLRGFTHLRVLRAGYTAIGDVTAKAAAVLPGLELLALPETKVTPECIAPLAKMHTLRTLRVSGTAAESAAQAAKLPVAPSAADLIPPLEPEAKKPGA